MKIYHKIQNTFFQIFDFSHIKENKKNGCDIMNDNDPNFQYTQRTNYTHIVNIWKSKSYLLIEVPLYISIATSIKCQFTTCYHVDYITVFIYNKWVFVFLKSAIMLPR